MRVASLKLKSAKRSKRTSPKDKKFHKAVCLMNWETVMMEGLENNVLIKFSLLKNSSGFHSCFHYSLYMACTQWLAVKITKA